MLKLFQEKFSTFNFVTICDIIKRAENIFGHERKAESGRIAKKMPKSKVTMLKTIFDHQDGNSLRQVARKFSILQSYVNNYLKISLRSNVIKTKKFRSEIIK